MEPPTIWLQPAAVMANNSRKEIERERRSAYTANSFKGRSAQRLRNEMEIQNERASQAQIDRTINNTSCAWSAWRGAGLEKTEARFDSCVLRRKKKPNLGWSGGGWCAEVSASGSETVSRRTCVCAHATHPEDGNGESHSECDYKEEPLRRQAQGRFRGRNPLTSRSAWAKLSIDAIHDASFGLLLRMLYVLRRPCAVYVTRSSILRTIFTSPKPTA